MKNRVKKTGIALLGAICMFNTLPLLSQNPAGSLCGVYLNSPDYTKGHLSYSFDCKSSGRIELHHLLAGKYADVIIDGKKTRLNKDSIFGYRNCKNEDYRFYKSYDEEFQILENKGIVIYQSYIRGSSYNSKNVLMVPSYFFSSTISSGILPLTLQNLKRVFAGNIKFQVMLDAEFVGGESVSDYSVNDKMYKVTLLFNKSNLN